MWYEEITSLSPYVYISSYIQSCVGVFEPWEGAKFGDSNYFGYWILHLYHCRSCDLPLDDRSTCANDLSRVSGVEPVSAYQ